MLGEGYSWEVNAILETKGEVPTDYGSVSFSYYLKELYAGEDLSKINDVATNNEELDTPTGDNAALVNKAFTTIQQLSESEIAQRFAKNPLGFALTYLYDGLRYILGDTFMTMAQALTFSSTKIAYDYSELSNEEYKNINEYTNVDEYNEVKKANEQKQIIIKKENDYEDEEYRRFSSSTKIPVITMDLYNIATDNIEFFDINFLVVDEEKHSEETPWLYFRNFITTIIHVTIYLAAIILLVLLIVNGIQIVGHSFNNPEARFESIKKLHKFAISLFMLAGTVIIMALCTYASNVFLDNIKLEDNKELPIRVNVEEANYSFSTNITGYFRYRSTIEGIHNYQEKGMYTIIYIALAWVNFVLALLMDLRVIIMMILAIEGPIIAVLYSFNIQGAIRYKKWVKTYAKFAFIQLFLVILYRVIFEYTI